MTVVCKGCDVAIEFIKSIILRGLRLKGTLGLLLINSQSIL